MVVKAITILNRKGKLIWICNIDKKLEIHRKSHTYIIDVLSHKQSAYLTTV